MAVRSAARIVGGLATLAAGVLWGVKSISILLIGYQPQLVFELAPSLFGLAVASLATDRRPTWRTRSAQVMGAVAIVAGMAAAASELAGAVWSSAIVTSMITVLVGLIMIGMAPRATSEPAGSTDRIALAIGLVTVPALLVGGVLSLFGERLLELPLLLLAGMWVWLGILMLRPSDPRRLRSSA